MPDTCQKRRFAILNASVNTKLSFEVKNSNCLMYTLFNTDAFCPQKMRLHTKKLMKYIHSNY